MAIKEDNAVNDWPLLFTTDLCFHLDYGWAQHPNNWSLSPVKKEEEKILRTGDSDSLDVWI